MKMMGSGSSLIPVLYSSSPSFLAPCQKEKEALGPGPLARLHNRSLEVLVTSKGSMTSSPEFLTPMS